MSVRPKVLHTMTWLAPGGGADRNVRLSIEGMIGEYDMHLAVGHEIHQNDFERIAGLTIHVCPWLDRDIHPLRDLKSIGWFRRLIQEEQFDLVHTHETKASLVTRLAARLAGHRRVIYGLHGVVFNDPVSSLKRGFYLAAERLTIDACDYIVPVSEDAIAQYHENGIGCDHPYRVVYSGNEVERFTAQRSGEERARIRAEFGISAEACVSINVGRFSPAKAQRYTIESFARVCETVPDAHLLLVGEGDERSACESLCRDLGISGSVTFSGFQSDVARLYAIADLHVMTSLREGLPSSAVEASLSRVPTVAYDVDGMREIVVDGISGYVVAQGDLDALTARIAELALLPERRAEFGAAAQVRASDRWDWRVMVKELDKVYRELLDR